MLWRACLFFDFLGSRDGVRESKIQENLGKMGGEVMIHPAFGAFCAFRGRSCRKEDI